MKKLVGRIFRDENGVETIEREPTEKYEVKWEVVPKIEKPNSRYPYRLIVTCPKCGHINLLPCQTSEILEWKLENFVEIGRKNMNYCGQCGAHNIVEL